MGVTSWNANRINGDKLEDAIDELQQAMGKRIILMQEVARLPVDPSIEGWKVLHGDSCAAAIAVPCELSSEIRWRLNSDITSSALIGELGVMSAYFADSGKSAEEFEKSVMTTRLELRKLRAAGATRLLVGCDAQVELPPDTVYTGPQALGDSSALGVAHDRQCQILSLLQEFGLRAASTWTGSVPFHTRKPWQANRKCTQLDYVFVSMALFTQSGVCNDRQYGASDHYPVWCDVLDSTLSLKTQRLRASLSGWRPLSGGDVEQFRCGVIEAIGLSGAARADMRSTQSLGTILDQIEQVAIKIPHSTNHSRRKSIQAKPIDLIRAEAASKAAAPGDDKKRRRREEGRLRRHWKAHQLLHTKPHPKRNITRLDCDGVLTEDRHAWRAELRRYCEDKYFDCMESEEVQKRRIATLRSVQHAAELDGQQHPILSVGVVLQARARLCTGRCFGGGEEIVAEMIRLLPIAAVYAVVDMFSLRYSGEVVEDLETWRTVIMIFLQKVANPTQLKQFRGISLLSVMSKWYMQCLYILAKRCQRPKAWDRVCIYSYECCLSTSHVTIALQLLLCRGWEWQLRSPVYVFNGDVKSAFDNMRPDVVVKALRAARLHPRIIAAMMAENVGAVCWPEFDGITLEMPVTFNKCARQGGVESAYQWNAVMFMCLAELTPLWHDSGYGVDLGGRRYTHAVWADNIWLFDHCPCNLKKMMQSLTAVLALHHLRWKPDSLCYMASVKSELVDMMVDDGIDVLKVPNVDSMEVLGVRLNKTGATTPSFQHRASRADKAFWSDKRALTCRSLSLQARFQRYAERIVPRMLHGCGSWAWSQSLYQSIAVWEGRALRRIVGAGRRSDEDWLPWFRRSTRLAKNLYLKLGHTPLATRVLGEIHRAASRLQPPCRNRFTAAASTVVLLADAIEWKDTWWWHREQAVGQLLDPRGGDWRHSPKFGNRGNTWDAVLVYAYGLEWNLVARDPVKWAASLKEFVHKAYEHAKSAVPVATERPPHPDASFTKNPRVLSDILLPWTLYETEIGTEIVGDNEIVINWMNGQAAASSQDQKHRVEELTNQLHCSWLQGLIAPRMPSAEWCRHVYRERNMEADRLANEAMDDCASATWHTCNKFPRMQQLCAHFDGGKRGDIAAACGWHLQGSHEVEPNGEPVWHTLAWGSLLLDPRITSSEAEFSGLAQAVQATLSWARCGAVFFNSDCSVR